MQSLPVKVAGKIRGVLERALPANAVESAFVLWENEFSSLPAFGIAGLVQELGKRHEMSDRERCALRLSLFRELHAVVTGNSSEDATVTKRVPTTRKGTADQPENMTNCHYKIASSGK